MMLFIDRKNLQYIVRRAAIEAEMDMTDYEAIYQTLDGTKGVTFLAYNNRFGCPLEQAFGNGYVVASENKSFCFFKDIFDEYMSDWFNVDKSIGNVYDVEIIDGLS